MRATLKYIARTRRFEQTFGDVTPPQGERGKERIIERSQTQNITTCLLIGITVPAHAGTIVKKLPRQDI
jgi:hypothetical protein